MIGTQIANYRIEEKLGEGGMGVVYKAIDVGLDRHVAVKVLTSELARDPALIERFRAEAKAQANLNHTNIATLYTFLNVEGNCVIAMEYVEGETFDAIIRRRGVIPADEAVPLFKQALLGIGFAHRMGIIHRDVKPSNIMVNRNGIVKVMDFGIAKVLGGQRLTRTGTYMGTVSYMSPEQIRNQPVDIRSDIYSLGVTLYEMLTAHLPFESESDFEVMSHHVNTPPPLPTRHYPYISKGVEEAVLKALEKNPDARFQTVEEFGAALEHPEGLGPMVVGTAAVYQTPTLPAGGGITPPPRTPVPGTVPPGAALAGASLPAKLPRAAALPWTPKKTLLAVGVGGLVILLGLAASVYFRTPKDNGNHGQVSTGGGSAGLPVLSQPASGTGPQQGASAGSKESQGSEAGPPPLASSAGQPAREKTRKPLVEDRPTQIVPPPKPPDPSLRFIQNAEAAFNEGRLMQPRQDSALYWARQAEQSGNTQGSAIEGRVVQRVLAQVNAARWGKNYNQALAEVSQLVEYYPNRDDFLELKMTIQNESDQYAEAQKQTLARQQYQARTKRYTFQHRHVVLGAMYYCVGVLTITPDGSVRFDCTGTNDPSGRCDRVSFPPGSIKQAKLNNQGGLHIATQNIGNFDFFGEPGDIQDALATITSSYRN